MIDRTHLCGTCLTTAALVALAGCSATPPAKLYALTPIAPPATAPAAWASTPAAIDIARVRLPEYLDREEIVWRSGQNEIHLDDNHHWAERPSVALTRVLAIDLSILTGRDARVLADETGHGPRLLLTIDLQRFEIAADGSAVLVGRWAASDAGAAERARGTLAFRQPVAASDTKPDAAAEVVALNRCLADAAAAISQGLARAQL